METKENAKSRSQPLTFSELIQGKTPVLVDFYADWCGPCKMMKPILQEVKKKLGDQINIIKVDVDRNQEAAMKYQIRGVPTLILFKNGRIEWRQSGVVPAAQLESILTNHLD